MSASKKRKLVSEALAQPIGDAVLRKKAKRKEIAPESKGSDEYQQVTRPAFVSRYRKELGYGADVFYQPDVSVYTVGT